MRRPLLLLGCAVLGLGCLERAGLTGVTATGPRATPAGVVLSGELVVVTDPGVDTRSGPTTSYAAGHVRALDAATGTLRATSATRFKNPLFVTAVDDRFYVSGPGPLVTSGGTTVATEDGGIDVFTRDGLLASAAPVASVRLAGAPGRVVPIGQGRAILPSALSPVLYRVVLDPLSVEHGPADPLRLPAPLDRTDQVDTLTVALAPGAGLVVTSFNTDLLLVLDPHTGATIRGPVSVRRDPQASLIEGPLDLAVCADGLRPDVFVMKDLSNLIAAVDSTTLAVEPAFAVVGPVANRIACTAGSLVVTNSGKNDVQVIDRVTGATTARIAYDPGCSPWETAVQDGRLVTTLYGCGRVALAELATAKLRWSVALAAP